MKAQEIRDLSEKEREDKITDLGQEIFNLRFQLATGKIENPSRLKSLRREFCDFTFLGNCTKNWNSCTHFLYKIICDGLVYGNHIVFFMVVTST